MNYGKKSNSRKHSAIQAQYPRLRGKGFKRKIKPKKIYKQNFKCKIPNFQADNLHTAKATCDKVNKISSASTKQGDNIQAHQFHTIEQQIQVVKRKAITKNLRRKNFVPWSVQFVSSISGTMLEHVSFHSEFSIVVRSRSLFKGHNVHICT